VDECGTEWLCKRGEKSSVEIDDINQTSDGRRDQALAGTYAPLSLLPTIPFCQMSFLWRWIAGVIVSPPLPVHCRTYAPGVPDSGKLLVQAIREQLNDILTEIFLRPEIDFEDVLRICSGSRRFRRLVMPTIFGQH
jgi:hypothetical protein